MANTYGGYIIIGAEEDGKGNLQAINGIETVPGGKQKLIQWCYDGTSPPLFPFISEIPHDNDFSKEFYVIYIEESLQAPHFINSRKGCYIRTDEHSQRFEPRLATYEELRFLTNRRQEALSLRDKIIARAIARFEQNTVVHYDQQLKDYATMSLAIVPRFPGPFSLEVASLGEAVRKSQMKARGSTSFPGLELKSTLESFYHSAPRVS